MGRHPASKFISNIVGYITEFRGIEAYSDWLYGRITLDQLRQADFRTVCTPIIRGELKDK